MSSTDQDVDGADRLERARALVRAIEAGDVEREKTIAEAIGGDLTDAIRAELAHLTEEIQRVLGKARVADDMTRLAQEEFPKAHLRLQQVLEMTEEAANQTLAAVEESLPLAGRLAGSTTALLERWPAGRSMDRAFKTDLQSCLQQVSQDAAQIRGHLSDVLVAQGYQDITGQIIHPVIRLVGELEERLSRGGGGDGHPALSGGRDDHHGNGPVVRGLESGSSVAGQDDVDDLLSQFGV